jgi:hypothetical protein
MTRRATFTEAELKRAIKAARAVDPNAEVQITLDRAIVIRRAESKPVAASEVTRLMDMERQLREAVAAHQLAYDQREHGGVADSRLVAAIKRIQAGLEHTTDQATLLAAALRLPSIAGLVEAVEAALADVPDGTEPSELLDIVKQRMRVVRDVLADLRKNARP